MWRRERIGNRIKGNKGEGETLRQSRFSRGRERKGGLQRSFTTRRGPAQSVTTSIERTLGRARQRLGSCKRIRKKSEAVLWGKGGRPSKKGEGMSVLPMGKKGTTPYIAMTARR